jgi:hypothetical protein
MAELPQLSIDAPIAGQSLTSELGNRPWENPPQYTTVEEALEYYIPRIMEPSLRNDMLNVLEMGVPITTFANALQMGAVMQGKHTIDVGVLVLPVLIETIAYVADMEGVEYNTGTEMELEDNTFSESNIALAKKRIQERMAKEKNKPAMKKEMPVEEDMGEEDMMEAPAPMGGLMARRA